MLCSNFAPQKQGLGGTGRVSRQKCAKMVRSLEKHILQKEVEALKSLDVSEKKVEG